MRGSNLLQLINMALSGIFSAYRAHCPSCVGTRLEQVFHQGSLPLEPHLVLHSEYHAGRGMLHFFLVDFPRTFKVYITASSALD